jgi:hypothetical protein
VGSGVVLARHSVLDSEPVSWMVLRSGTRSVGRACALRDNNVVPHAGSVTRFGLRGLARTTAILCARLDFFGTEPPICDESAFRVRDW